MSEFAHSQFMNSEFSASHLGTEYSLHETSTFAGEDGGFGGERSVGTREWARQQQSQRSSQFTAESDRDNPWKATGRDMSGKDLSSGGAAAAAAGPGRGGVFPAEDGRMHDLPPLAQNMKPPSSRSVLSHDLSGFSDFDPVPPTRRDRDYAGSSGSGSGSGGGVAGDITAPHPAPSDRRNWKRAGLTEAAALAAEADAQNLVRQEQREREAAEAADKKKRAAKKSAALQATAAAPEAGTVPGNDGNGGGAKRPPGARAGGATVRDVGDTKEEDRSQGMSEFRASSLAVREETFCFVFRFV